jgi:general L-amino acid transport system permease protein
VKDSSLGFAIAFPELVSISKTAINHTGQPIEILAVTICVFLLLNLLISAMIASYGRARPWVPA